MKKILATLSILTTLYSNQNIDLSALKQKAKNGNIEASFKLGILYYKGKNIKRNLDLAMLYFKRAAIYDNPKALYNIATIYTNKHYAKYNIKKAISIYNTLARQDYPPAQNKLALALLYGIGVEKDYKKAKQWLEVAYFENHYLEAGCNLAYIYTYGKGVLVNLGRARKVAQKGYDKRLPRCIKIYNEFKLYKYPKDLGFKFGYYRD